MFTTASLVEGEAILQNAKGMNHSGVQKYCKAYNNLLLWRLNQIQLRAQKLWTSPRGL